MPILRRLVSDLEHWSVPWASRPRLDWIPVPDLAFPVTGRANSLFPSPLLHSNGARWRRQHRRFPRFTSREKTWVACHFPCWRGISWRMVRARLAAPPSAALPLFGLPRAPRWSVPGPATHDRELSQPAAACEARARAAGPSARRASSSPRSRLGKRRFCTIA
jgi:hypothetical protein